METETDSRYPNPPQNDWNTLEALYNLLIEAQDLQTICTAALAFLLQQSERSGGCILVQKPAEATPYLLVQQNIPVEWAANLQDPRSELRALAEQVLLSGHPFTSEAQIGGSSELHDLAAILPIRAQSGVQGAVIIQGQVCPAGQIERLLRLTYPVGRALHASRANPPLMKLSREPASMQALINSLGFHPDGEAEQAQFLQALCQILAGDAGALILVEEDNDRQVARKTLRKDDPSWFEQANLPLQEGLIMDCLSRGEALLVGDAGDEPRLNAGFDLPPGIEAQSLLCVPLATGDQVLGAIQIFSQKPGAFTAEDLEWLAMSAGLTAQAIYSSRLIQQLKVANIDLDTHREELLRSRNTLRALFDSMPAALYIVDRDHKLIAVNMSCAERSGDSPRQLVGRQCYAALYHREMPCPQCRIEETFQSGQSTTRSGQRKDPNGENSEWEISTFPIVDESDHTVQVILLEQDVTEKRRLEAIIAQSEKLAAVGQLAAGVAHEINNPLTAIIANAQILMSELPADDEMQEAVELIARAGARAAQVVRNLLDFSRKEPYHRDPTNLNDSIRSSLALVQHELNKRSIHLAFEAQEDLPLISASQDHLTGVWLNLLLNAVDAIETRDGKIQISTTWTGDEIRVSIRDNGRGIPPERLQHIFEPFYTTKAPGRGTGLGLSVCHQIVKQHRGHIEVNSQEGLGTEFIVVLPVS